MITVQCKEDGNYFDILPVSCRGRTDPKSKSRKVIVIRRSRPRARTIESDQGLEQRDSGGIVKLGSQRSLNTWTWRGQVILVCYSLSALIKVYSELVSHKLQPRDLILTFRRTSGLTAVAATPPHRHTAAPPPPSHYVAKLNKESADVCSSRILPLHAVVTRDKGLCARKFQRFWPITPLSEYHALESVTFLLWDPTIKSFPDTSSVPTQLNTTQPVTAMLTRARVPSVGHVFCRAGQLSQISYSMEHYFDNRVQLFRRHCETLDLDLRHFGTSLTFKIPGS
ncbi:hypothetical protein J6590_029815 [Homalodisca vitripennis]|nr:hypothetical protein J6590_029815 [Homalodisca vitripennis]